MDNNDFFAGLFRNSFSFSLLDVLALIGLVQSVAVIVYILFRAGHWKHVIVPVLCFLVLGSAFVMDFGAGRLAEDLPVYRFFQNALWVLIPAFSVLMIVQVAEPGELPRPRYWVNLLPSLLAVIVGWVAGWAIERPEECGLWEACAVVRRLEAELIFGMLAGLVSILFVWLSRGAFASLRAGNESRAERYWLILSFIVMDLLYVFTTLLFVSDSASEAGYLLLRNVLGVGMCYVASTSLFRIYPPSVRLERKAFEGAPNEDDRILMEKIVSLFDLEKIYQEPNFSRFDLARELDISEARASRLVNICFGKSLPQVVNERRIRDSLQLLEQTDAQISVVADQVGFASLPTFNRVFRELMDLSPSEYRQGKSKLKNRA